MATLSDAVKNVSLAILKEINEHKLAGGQRIVEALQMIEQGVDMVADVKEHLTEWTEILKQLLSALKPFFDMIRDFLVSCYEHMVALFDWCKEMWNKLFN